jgi:hypothetical protein
MTSKIRSQDRGRGIEHLRVGDVISVKDHVRWRAQWDIIGFSDPDGEVAKASRQGLPTAELERLFKARLVKHQTFEGNLLLNEGINAAWTLICGGGGTAFNNANSYIGAGDSNTTANASQTALQASTNKLYKAMDGGYPTYGSSQYAVWRATFGTGDANFSWQEITVANGNSDSATNLNRKVQDMGTKTSAVSRVTTLTITLA